MSAPEKDNASHPADALEALHQRVNEMLDMPLPDETEIWSLRLDNSLTNIRPGHRANVPAAQPKSPS